MLHPVTAPFEMNQWDAAARKMGIPEAVLMENAARAVLAALRERTEIGGKTIWIFTGKGNNGGDGYCLARLLLDAGAKPVLLSPRHADDARPDGAAALNRLLAQKCGVPHVFFGDTTERGCALSAAETVAAYGAPGIVVDALLGMGAKGGLRPDTGALVRLINSVPAFTCAIDIPTGLDAMTGLPCPAAVRADMTVTFQAPKPGLVLPNAAEWTGELIVSDIGIPVSVRRELPASFCALTSPIREQTPPPRHKGDAGRVLVWGGSPSYKGALRLAVKGALRGGAGLVYAAGNDALLAGLADSLPEAVTLSIPDGDAFPESAAPTIAGVLKKCRAAVLGPGLGDDRGAVEKLLAIRREASPDTAFVLDADALNILAERPRLLGSVSPRDVLTPHPAEAARLLGCTAGEVQSDRSRALERLRGLCPGVWVLKGAGTLAADTKGPVFLCGIDAPLLAAAGSGDVLSGLIAALIAQRIGLIRADGVPEVSASAQAAFLAVQMHAEAGRGLERSFPRRRGATASDIADAINFR